MDRSDVRSAPMVSKQPLRASLSPYVAALAWVDLESVHGLQHAALPSDLLTLSLRIGGEARALRDPGIGLEVVISPLRTQTRRFVSSGCAQIAIASLTPRGILGVLRCEIEGLCDRPVPLRQLCGQSREQELSRALDACHTFTQNCEALARWLEARIAEHPALSTSDLRVASASETIGSTDPRMLDLNEVARSERVTRRQLERDFRDRLGVSPWTYARLVRFQRAAGAVARGEALLHAAIDSGFSDQAHMNRAFRTWASVTPRELAVDGALPGRDLLRDGLAGRVFMLDVARATSALVAAEPALPGDMASLAPPSLAIT